jgi:hypothetical protein
MVTRLAAAASSSAASDPRLVGVLPAWITTLIGLLLPGVMNLFPCLNPSPTPASVQADLEADYDEKSQTYHNSLGPMWHRARRESKQQGHPITIDQARAIAQHTLDQARTCSPDVLQEALHS